MFKRLKLIIARMLSRHYLRKRLKSISLSDFHYVLFSVPSHGNLGDHLIAIAEQKYIYETTGKRPIVFTTGDIFYGYDLIKNCIPQNATILITGGGFLGSVWPEEENRVCNIIHDFPENKIIILPQSIYYGSDSNSIELLIKVKNIYNGHKDLTLCVRENYSYDFALNVIRHYKVLLMPDFALYLKFEYPKEKRQDILLCLRNDIEKGNAGLTPDNIKRLFIDDTRFTEVDTYKPYPISQQNSENEISDLVKAFKGAKLVITDRLHGLLYAVITMTPVIAFDNTTNKIRNVYETWLKDVPYIKFAQKIDQIPDLATQLSNLKDISFDNSRFISQLSTIL